MSNIKFREVSQDYSYEKYKFTQIWQGDLEAFGFPLYSDSFYKMLYIHMRKYGGH